ncbi:MAG: tetratricopeptide repeat protein [Candidatus Poseidoniales archaeon]|nr:MAG: tetratricopeptide repeat protein [Candidatus Poseidoniales archaeon]
MESSDDSNAVNAGENDKLDEVALASVDEAIEAVENQPIEPVSQSSETVAQAPRDVIPELDDVENPEEMVEILLTVGEERSRRDDVKGALAAFNKAIALDPSCDMAWFNRGVLLEAQQDARGARQSFQICLDLNDQHAPATANLSILLERIGDLEGAYSMAEKALSFFPGHPALVQLRERCKDSGITVSMEAMQPSLEVTQSVDMKVVEEIAEESGIENPEDLLQEAIHHDHDEDAELSVEELKSAADVVVAQQEIIREIEPEVPELPEPEAEPAVDIDALVEQATASIKDGNPKEALALLKPHLKTIGAQHAAAWRIAGGAMARLDLDNHAIAAMTHAQNLEPSHAPGWFNLGSVQQRSNLTQEALISYNKAIEADAGYVKAAEKMADLAKEKGLIESYMGAARTLIGMENAHPIRGDFIEMLLQLAQGESDVLDQVAGLPPTLPAGPEMAKEALEFMDKEPSPQRARALSLSLQHSDAVLMWKELIKQEQHSSDHWTGLARSLEQAGDLDTAQKCHAKAVSLANAEGDAPVAAPQAPESVPITPQPVAISPQPTPSTPLLTETPAVESAQAELLLMPVEPQPKSVESVPQPEVDLAKAALDAAQTVANNVPQSTTSNAIANQDVTWFNQGVQLIDDKKYKEALSCFDRALPAFAGDDAMIIRILNNRGNAYYFLEEYPKCVESYHQAMLIRPTEVRGETLYNMGTAYAEMERYKDAIKCFEQAIPRGLADEAKRRAKDQIRRCNILQKAVDKKRKKR